MSYKLASDHQRLLDLVRYMRSDLSEAKLINDKEYAELLNVQGSVARLESYDEMRRRIAALEAENARLREDKERLVTARPFDEYHEDMGPVLWHRFPICEPPYCGTPLDNSFLWLDEGEQPYYTHWTPLPSCNEIQERYDAALGRHS